MLDMLIIADVLQITWHPRSGRYHEYTVYGLISTIWTIGVHVHWSILFATKSRFSVEVSNSLKLNIVSSMMRQFADDSLWLAGFASASFWMKFNGSIHQWETKTGRKNAIFLYVFSLMDRYYKYISIYIYIYNTSMYIYMYLYIYVCVFARIHESPFGSQHPGLSLRISRNPWRIWSWTLQGPIKNSSRCCAAWLCLPQCLPVL